MTRQEEVRGGIEKETSHEMKYRDPSPNTDAHSYLKLTPKHITVQIKSEERKLANVRRQERDNNVYSGLNLTKSFKRRRNYKRKSENEKGGSILLPPFLLNCNCVLYINFTI